MVSKLLHIIGPFYINSFGISILIGILVFTWLSLKHPFVRKTISHDQFIETLLVGIVSGVVGGRALYCLSTNESFESFSENFAIWDGGLSHLGSVIAVISSLFIYVKVKNISILKYFDFIAIHIPILHVFVRIGCFLTGCCYGKPCDLPWAIVYTTSDIDTPLNISIHPTQLYSALTLLFIFIFMYFIAQKIFKKDGQLFCLYLSLISFERFSIDFLRNDRFLTSHWPNISVDQIVAAIVLLMSTVALLIISLTISKNKKLN